MPNEILFVGTEDGLAIYQPASRGAWRRVAHVLAGCAVRALVVTDAETLLAALDGRPPQQSFDGGTTWSDATGSPPEPIGLRVATAQGPADVAYPRLRGATAYARLRTRPPALLGAGADGALLFRSEDDGIHWQPAAMPAEPVGRIVSLAPATSSAAAWAGTASGALLRSDDRGRSWRLIAREPAGVLCLAAAAD
jgi:hypothetical protein